MKKIIISLLLLVVFMISISTQKTHAVTITSAPYDTYTIGPKGDLVLTQTAYEPAGILSMSESLNKPQDLYIKDNVIYIADTGNHRVISVDQSGNTNILVENLGEPTGVHVDEENQLYIVDKSMKVVYVYHSDLTLKMTIDRPDEPIFGKNSPFIPFKITTGPRGIIYITGEGSVSGVMQFNHRGEFLGYLATNPTNASFYRKILEFFNQNLAPITPLSPENIAIDAKGSLYTTSRTESDQLKKFNIASQIILAPTNYSEDTIIATYVNDFGNIYAVSEKGIIQEYDASGNLLFTFGGTTTTPVLGLFTKSQDIVVDSNYNLYVLDQEQGVIQILARSEFAAVVHDGLQSLNSGIYDVTQWENVLRMNSVFALANSVIAKTYYRIGDYDTALTYYKIANDRTGYSEAFWQVRNEFLQNYLGLIFGLILLFIIIRFILKLIDKKYRIFDPLRSVDKRINEVKVFRELRYGLRMFKHPLDSFHELKFQKKSSVLTATIIFGIFVVLNIIAIYSTGFLFNANDLENYNIVTSFLGLSGILILFIFANYLISSLFNGEGWFKDIYIGTAYALIPYLIFTIPIILLSHTFTLNEIFIFNAMITIRDVWVLVLLVLMVMEIHNYKVGELLRNLILTIFTMALLVAILLLVYLLISQMYEYIMSIFREVINRVSS